MSLNEPKPKTEAEAYSEYIARSRKSREDLPPDPESAGHDPPREHRGVHRQPDPAGARKPAAKEPRYRVEGEIARGGMAAILKVWDSDLRRTLAMKVILSDKDRPPDASTADMRLSRFLGEAQITGQLDHPGVVPVHELGLDENGRVYFTMRLVKGDNFGEVIQKVRNGTDGWNLTRAINVLHRVCETMAYAHSKGVVHRDLKPENVMVGRFGETYAMDWGVARLLDNPDAEATRQEVMDSATSSAFIMRRDILTETASRTQAGAIMGTPCYMPPEQAAGEIDSIGPQSDIYAVGAILYQLLTGTRPYARAAAQSPLAVVRAVLEGPPTPIHELERKVSPELAAICERAMARAPADRYPSMVQMAADLQAYLEGKVVHAYKTGAVAEFVKWVRRNRGFSAALAGLVLVTIAGLATFAWNQGEKASARVVEQDRMRAERDDAVAERDQARQKVWLANVTAAHASLAAGETADGKRYLADCVADARGWEWHHLSLTADASIAVFDAQAGPISGLALDATGDRLVAGVTFGSPRVFDLGARRVAVVLEDNPSDTRPLRAPAVAFVDGGLSVAAFGHEDERIRVWNAAAGNITRTLELLTPAQRAIAMSPLGNRVALGAADHSICIVDPLTGDEMGRLTGHRDTVSSMTFSADGLQLVSGSEDRSVRIWDVASLREVRRIETAGAVHSVAKSPMDGEIAVGLADGSIRRYGADGATRDQLSGHRGHVLGLTYDHPGTRLASASGDKTVRVWNTADGRQLAMLAGHDLAVTHVQFAAKGSLLASGSADGTVRLWDPDRNRAGVVCRSRDGQRRVVDITRDGTLVAIAADRPGTIEVIDADSGAQRLVVSGGPAEDSVVAVQFSPSGEHLAVAFRGERSVRICDVASGRLGEALRHDATPTGIAWSPDGTTIATGCEDRKVRLWDVGRHEATLVLEHPLAVIAVAFCCDGARVAAGTSDGSVHVCEVPSGKSLLVIPGDGKAAQALAYAPEGGALAVGYHDGGIRIFAPDATVARLTLAGHHGTVNALRYLPDGSRLVSGAADDTVRLWEAATGRLVLALRDHEAPVTGVAAGGANARIVSATADGTVRIRYARSRSAR